MEKNEYKVMYGLEDHYWLYVALRRLVFSYIDTFSNKKRNLNVLDAGCGTGKVLDCLRNHSAYGLEFSEQAIKYCKLRGLDTIARGSICDIPFKNNFFNVVICLDVLYHMEVENDLKALKELYQATSKEGIIIITLPAYKFLYSRHDEAVHTRQRYTMKELRKKVEKAGFEIEKITYRHTILFPLFVIKRMIDKFSLVSTEKKESDLKVLPELLNNFLIKLVLLENLLIILGVKFPFGLSLFCVARKK